MNKLSIKIAPEQIFNSIKAGKHKDYLKTPIEVGSLDRYTFRDCKTSSEPMMTEYINTCTAVVINDSLLHLAPESYRNGDRKVKLGEQIFELISDYAKKGQDISALIFGGKAGTLDIESRNFTSDIDIMIEKALNKLNIDGSISAIFGKKQNIYRDKLYKNGDEIIISQEGNRKLDECLHNNANAKAEDILENYYEIVDIDPNHHLNIFG